MKTRFKKSGGYTEKVAGEYIEENEAIYSVSVELEEQFKFVDNKKTDEVTGYKAWFIQEGLPPFVVKFEKKISLPKYLSIITFENLQGIEVNYNVYFKADDIKVVK